MEKKFSSKLGFILTAVGSAVGMANIWGFPYKLAEGGLIFLLFYILFVILFSYVGASAEFAIGRLARTGALGSYEYAYKSKKQDSKIARYVGYIPIIGAFLISIGYSVVIAYVLKALADSINGVLMNTDPTLWFESFSSKSYSVVPYHFIVIILTLLTCYDGAKTIEKTNKIIMPAFFILFVGLAIRVATLTGALEGYKYMLRFDLSKLNVNTIITAMGQAFFSLSITGAIMIMVGAYLTDDIDIVGSARELGFYDTISALVASCVIIPALTVFNLGNVSGPGLLFIALPTVLQNIAFGRIFAIILYIAVIFAGVSSLQSLFETVTESLVDRFPKLSRGFVLVILGITTFGVGVTMENIERFGPYMDIVSIYIIPIGASIGALSWFYVLNKDKLLTEVNRSSKRKYGDRWYKVGKYIYVPLAITLTILALVFKISF